MPPGRGVPEIFHLRERLAHLEDLLGKFSLETADLDLRPNAVRFMPQRLNIRFGLFELVIGVGDSG